MKKKYKIKQLAVRFQRAKVLHDRRHQMAMAGIGRGGSSWFYGQPMDTEKFPDEVAHMDYDRIKEFVKPVLRTDAAVEEMKRSVIVIGHPPLYYPPIRHDGIVLTPPPLTQFASAAKIAELFEKIKHQTAAFDYPKFYPMPK